MDDTDSKKGGCTTYIGALLIRRFEELGLRLIGFPRLIRLNPNCPFKTRGNAAIALKLQGEYSSEVEDLVAEVIEEYAELGEEGTEPGVVFLEGEPSEELRRFYWRAVWEIIPLEEAFKLAEKIGVKMLYYKDGRGIIGALAAVGADLTAGKTKTYELIAHRRRDYWGTVRHIDSKSVFEMDRATRPYTFDNVDYESGEIRIAPHTPCPVLLGIRGIDPKILEKAFGMLRIGEPVEMVTIFETNQGTDVHLRPARIAQLRDGMSAIVTGKVLEKPRFEIGGHVFFKLSDGTGELTCAAYEPTKSFRNVVAKLLPGDEVTVYGAVKLKPQGLTLNLEKIHVRKPVEAIIKRPPKCPKCGKRMESMGAGKGYRCKRCKTRLGSESAEIIKLPREITLGFYEVPPSARRHLAKPLNLQI